MLWLFCTLFVPLIVQYIEYQCILFLNMERGKSNTGIQRLEAIEFKIKKKEEDLQALEEKYNEMKTEISSKKFEELIVKEPDFLGFQKMKTDKTLMNFEKTFKIQKSQLQKNKSEIESKSRQITELKTKIESLQKEVFFFKSKNATLLTNETAFAVEKKKYLDLVVNVIEKTIKNERLKVTFHGRLKSKDFKISDEVARVCEKISQDNDIPLSAFKEIFKNTNNTAHFFNLLHFGDYQENKVNNHIEQEESEKKRGLRR